MTNKYSGLSDFEVNELIAKHKGYKNIREGLEKGSVSFSVYEKFSICDHVSVEFKNYCFSYQDAMELMIDNEIGLVKGKNSWFAEDGERLRAPNTNPCRAIAECFLLMKDAENDDEK